MTGIVSKIDELKEGTSARTGAAWKRRAVVITTEEEPGRGSVVLQLRNDEALSVTLRGVKLEEGMPVKLNLTCRAVQNDRGYWNNEVWAWGIEG